MSRDAAGGWTRGAGLRRAFWLGGGTILTAAALVAIAAVLEGDFSDRDGKILGTLGVLFVAGSAALAGLGLVERRTAAVLGRAVAAASPLSFAVLAAAIWSGSEDEILWRWAGTAGLLLAAGLVSATSRLLARGPRALALFALTSCALAVASAITLAAIWADDAGAGTAKGAAVFWILTALGYFLTPVVQRSASPPFEGEPRVLVTLDGVELTGTFTTAEDEIVVAPMRGRLALRLRGEEIELRQGELLAVRPRRHG